MLADIIQLQLAHTLTTRTYCPFMFASVFLSNSQHHIQITQEFNIPLHPLTHTHKMRAAKSPVFLVADSKRFTNLVLFSKSVVSHQTNRCQRTTSASNHGCMSLRCVFLPSVYLVECAITHYDGRIIQR